MTGGEQLLGGEAPLGVAGVVCGVGDGGVVLFGGLWTDAVHGFGVLNKVGDAFARGDVGLGDGR